MQQEKQRRTEQAQLLKNAEHPVTEEEMEELAEWLRGRGIGVDTYPFLPAATIS